MPDRIPKLESDLEGLRVRFTEFVQRYEREVREREQSNASRHKENSQRLAKLGEGQQKIMDRMNQLSGGVAVIRAIVHMFWLIIGSAVTFIGQYIFSHK